MNSLNKINKNTTSKISKSANNDNTKTVISNNNNNVKSINNGTPKPGDQVYIIPYKGVNVNNHLYNVLSYNESNGDYTLKRVEKNVKPSLFSGISNLFSTEKKLIKRKKGNISPRKGYTYTHKFNNGTEGIIEIGKEYMLNANKKIKAVSKPIKVEGQDYDIHEHFTITTSKNNTPKKAPARASYILGKTNFSGQVKK